ncbi:MAG: AAA family ATPase, partial [Ignisphaera sp.]|nr:AAA family ATPase [Ignisphaera sp.]
IEIIGEPAVGKTHLSLTFPKPFIFDTTPKKEAEIIAYKVLGAEAKNRYRWIQTWQQLVSGVRETSRRDDVKTIVIDTGTDLQALAVEYELEAKSRERLLPFEYGRIREVIDTDITETIINSNKNLVLTAQMDDEYINGQKTGYRVPKGYKRAAFQSDIRILLVIGSCSVEIMPGATSFKVIPKTGEDNVRKAIIIKNRFIDMSENPIQVLKGNITAQDIKNLIPKELVSLVWTE